MATQQPFVMMMYRAESSASPWHGHLLNADAANDAGVLSYLHTEVIPLDQGSGKSNTNNECQRKFSIDSVMRFEVTILNPPPHQTPPLGDYLAFDGGKCTVDNCAQKLDQDGFFVGQQYEAENPRHKYKSGQWYSLPADGLCSTPNGSHNCTYHARPMGHILVDDLVNQMQTKKQIDPDYYQWCMSGGIEFERAGKDPPDACQVTQSVLFWEGVCDETKCNERVNQFNKATWNTVLSNGCDAAIDKKVYKNGKECVAMCPLGTFEDWTYTCQPCPFSGCGECDPAKSPGASSLRCTACLDVNATLSSNGCTKAPPEGGAKSCSWCTTAVIIAVASCAGLGMVLVLYWICHTQKNDGPLLTEVPEHESVQHPGDSLRQNLL